MQQRLFFLCKLNSFNVDQTIVQMFYKSILENILTFCLICVFSNMWTQDRNKLERVVKQARKIIGFQQESPEALYKSLICNKIKICSVR